MQSNSARSNSSIVIGAIFIAFAVLCMAVLFGTLYECAKQAFAMKTIVKAVKIAEFEKPTAPAPTKKVEAPSQTTTMTAKKTARRNQRTGKKRITKKISNPLYELPLPRVKNEGPCAFPIDPITDCLENAAGILVCKCIRFPSKKGSNPLAKL